MRNLIAFLFLSLFIQASTAVPTEAQFASVPEMFRELLIEHGLLLDAQQGDTPESKHQNAKFLALCQVDFYAARGSEEATWAVPWDSANAAAQAAARDTAWVSAWFAVWYTVWDSAWGASATKVRDALDLSTLTDPTEIDKYGYKLAEYFILEEMLTDIDKKYEGRITAAYQAALPKLSDGLDQSHLLKTIADYTWKKPELADNHFISSLRGTFLPFWTPGLHKYFPKAFQEFIMQVMLAIQRSNDSPESIGIPPTPSEMGITIIKQLRLNSLPPNPIQ